MGTIIGIYKPAAVISSVRFCFFDGWEFLFVYWLNFWVIQQVTWLETDLFTISLGFLMLSMGLTLTFEDFRRCLRNPWTVRSNPYTHKLKNITDWDYMISYLFYLLKCWTFILQVGVGFLAQYLIKPMLGFFIATVCFHQHLWHFCVISYVPSLFILEMHGLPIECRVGAISRRCCIRHAAFFWPLWEKIIFHFDLLPGRVCWGKNQHIFALHLVKGCFCIDIAQFQPNYLHSVV